MSNRTDVGSFRNSRFGFGVADALAAVQRNPIAAMLMAAGAGWLIGTVRERRMRNPRPRRRMGGLGRIPVLNTGQARLYDPDASPLHPMQDSLESRREMSARV
jgi:hypothetical protein